MSKGSTRRPQFVSDQQMATNWDRTFGKAAFGTSASEDEIGRTHQHNERVRDWLDRTQAKAERSQLTRQQG